MMIASGACIDFLDISQTRLIQRALERELVRLQRRNPKLRKRIEKDLELWKQEHKH